MFDETSDFTSPSKFHEESSYEESKGNDSVVQDSKVTDTDQ